MGRLAAGCAALLLASTGFLGAQSRSANPIEAARFSQDALAENGAGAALLSFAVPGAAQLRADRHRGWIYAGVEAVAWGVFLERRGGGATFRSKYRDLAWEQGRLQTGAREDGDFRFYETLAHWTRSGAFDVDPASVGLQPEPDPSTFNGSIWERARLLFLAGAAGDPADPQFARALAYYEEHTFGEAFLWDWSANPGAQGDFARLIERSDDRFRQATTVLGAILLNHLVSGVDAVLGARTGDLPGRVEAAPFLSPLGSGLSFTWTIDTSR